MKSINFFKQYRLAMLMVFILLPIALFAQGESAGINWEEIATGAAALLNAPLAYLAVQASKLIKKVVPSVLLGFLLPVVSAVGAFIISKISPETPFLLALGLGLVSTWIDQLKRNL